MWDGNGGLYSKEKYLESLKQKSNEERYFGDLSEPLNGVVVVDKLKEEFELWMDIINIFKCLPPISYEKYTNVNLQIATMKTHKYPMGNKWH